MKPRFTITHQINQGIAQIERARGFLEAAQLSETWVRQMSAHALLLEAHHTTHIEGTRLTLAESAQAFAGEELLQADTDDVQELLNYREAFNLVSDYLTSGAPITEGLIREIHKRLVKGVRGDQARPGQYRLGQNYIANSVTREIIYTPPPPSKVPNLMRELVQWVNQPGEIHSVLVSGIAQYQLVHIHPFVDGNGRTSRLLSTLCLYHAGYDFKRLFTISEYYDRNRKEFYAALQEVRESDMDLTVWLEYFVTGLVTQLHEVQARGERAIQLDVVEQQHKLNSRQMKSLRFLLLHNTISIQEYEQLCPSVTRRTLQRDLSDLIAKEFVCEVASTPTDPNRSYEMCFEL